MKNYIIRYGLWGGIISIILGLTNWFTIAQFFDPVVSKTAGYLSIILSLMCVPLGIRYFRDKLNDGSVTFGRAFNVGFGITLVASIISFFYGVLFFVFAGESFQEWNKKGLSSTELTELQAQIEQTPDFVFTPLFQGFVFFLTVLIIGLIINLISSLLLRRTPIKN